VRARDSYGVLFALIVCLLIATSLGQRSDLGGALVAILNGAVLLYALWTARAGRHVLRTALVVVPTIVLIIAVASGRSSDAASAAVAAGEASLALGAIVAIGRQLVTHPRVSASTILGALCMYLLIGLFFASVYAVADVVGPDPFFRQVAVARPVDFLYFSYVTLATVGYGDLTAARDVGRMLAVTEALLGQLFLVTVVALIIGNVGRGRHRA
jgi:hypothetical protein